MTKICVTCGEEKDLKFFYFRTDTNKYRGQCKFCNKGYKNYRELMGQYIKDGKKRCSRCDEYKTTDNFHKDKHTTSGLSSKCKFCIKKFQATRKEETQIKNISTRYSVDMETAKRLYTVKQCDICDSSFDGRVRRATDHCHITGKVRGVLCSRCNLGLGYFDDDINKLKKAINYLI